jgi:imidazoleglycerol-phosphate dehydratase/histidinol-phosphatase
LGYRIQTGDGRENANRDVLHFFKSFSDAKANINIKAEGQNEHHKIEAILTFAKAIKVAVKRDTEK